MNKIIFIITVFYLSSSNSLAQSFSNKNEVEITEIFIDTAAIKVVEWGYLDSSKGVFNGKIMVRKDAQSIDAFQANNNLLLSDNSSIDI